jgi:hypothetical protein
MLLNPLIILMFSLFTPLLQVYDQNLRPDET